MAILFSTSIPDLNVRYHGAPFWTPFAVLFFGQGMFLTIVSIFEVSLYRAIWTSLKKLMC